MTFAIKHPTGGYFVRFDSRKGLCFTRDQTKADFFPDKASALARWSEGRQKAKAKFLKEWASVPAGAQLKRLNHRELYWYEQRCKKAEIAENPIIATMPEWMLWEGDPPLFEIPDPQALTEQVSLFMARSRGKWVVSQNNSEGLTLSDSCDKAPCFLSIEAAEHYLKRHRFHFQDVVFVEFAAFAKGAIPSGAAKLGDFEQGLNSRAEGREIRLSLEPSPKPDDEAPRRRSAL